MSGPRPGAPGTAGPGFRGGRVPPFVVLQEAVRAAAENEKAQQALAEVFGPVNAAGSEVLRGLLDEQVRAVRDRAEEPLRLFLIAAGVDPADRSDGWQHRALDVFRRLDLDEQMRPRRPDPLLILAGTAQLARATASDLGLPSSPRSPFWRYLDSDHDLRGRSRVRVCYGHRWFDHRVAIHLDRELRAIRVTRGPDAVQVVELPEGRR